MKRANLSLSINSIVVLILAVTMLGLGLGFMRNTFGGATESFDQVTEQMKKEMSEKLKSTSKDVDVNAYELDIQLNKEKVFYLGIKNEGSDPMCYKFNYTDGLDSCNLNDCTIGDVNIKAFNEGEVPGHDVSVIPISLTATSDLDNKPITIMVSQIKKTGATCPTTGFSFYSLVDVYVTAN